MSRFTTRLVLCVALGAGLALWVHDAVQSGFRLGFDVQQANSCLPMSVFTYRLGSLPSSPGELVVLDSSRMPRDARLKGRLVKFVVGLPGDTVSIREGVVRINGEVWGRTMLAPVLGKPANGFDGEWTVRPGQVFTLGTTPSSYDSRYWGPAQAEWIVGVAHAIL